MSIVCPIRFPLITIIIYIYTSHAYASYQGDNEKCAKEKHVYIGAETSLYIMYSEIFEKTIYDNIFYVLNTYVQHTRYISVVEIYQELNRKSKMKEK